MKRSWRGVFENILWVEVNTCSPISLLMKEPYPLIYSTSKWMDNILLLFVDKIKSFIICIMPIEYLDLE